MRSEEDTPPTSDLVVKESEMPPTTERAVFSEERQILVNIGR